MRVIDEFAAESIGKIRVGKLNVDKSPNVSAKYTIRSVPTLFVFDNAGLKESFPGALKKQDLMMKMARYL